MNSRERDRLAVLLGPEGALSPAEIVLSAAELADIVFLLDSRDHAAPGLRAIAAALAVTEAADLGDVGACLGMLSKRKVSAVTTFTDALCPVAARLGRLVGGGTASEPPSPEPPSPEPPWGRKDVQRSMLVAAGVSAVPSAPVPDEDSLRAFLATAGFPLVVKPVDGVASRDAWLLRDERDLRELLDRSGLGGPGAMFAEQFITGAKPPVPHLADYVSVEVFRPGPVGCPAAASFVSDRLPPSWPLRETGVVLPSVLDPAGQRLAADVACHAIDALGAASGAFHVELKLTQPAPEVIEVNGRLGGFITRLVRYGTGADLGRAALSCALRRDPDLVLNWARCVLVLFFQPPARAHVVTRAPSRREITRMPGVLSVDEIVSAGSAVDWRNGTNRPAARVWLAADSHGELRARLVDVATFLTGEFGFADETGAQVKDVLWLDRISGQAAEEGCP